MNKVAIITGSCGGIGKALVNAYIEDGYFVIGLDKKSPENIDSKSYFALSIDLLSFAKNKEHRLDVIDEIYQHLPRVINDLVLINNAAEQIIKSAKDITWEDWEHSLGVNVLAPFFLIQALSESLAINRGHVVNVTSIHAKLTKPGFICYATSKAALESITRSLALELSPLGISVNAVAPAAIATEMLLAGFVDEPQKLRELKNFHPAKVVGKPEEIASFIKSITDHKSAFLTGAVLEFSGGIGGRLHDPND